MTVWVLRNGELVDKRIADPHPAEGKILGRAPYVSSDIKAYMSVATNRVVDGRRDQREDLKVSGCRLADSSEAPKFCYTEKWSKALGLPRANKPKPKERITRIGPEV
jgi:hypothetical protein